MDVPGVGLLTEPRREYPARGLAAPVVGFSGVDGDGLAGLELGLDELLSGRSGKLWLERAPSGLDISTAPREVVPSVPGRDVVLTLDREVQAATERVLARAVAGHGAQGGSAIVLDVASGEVLAMASQGERPHRGGAPERNRVVTDVFEPGSVNKVITASAALEEGVILADEVMRVPDGYEVGGKRFTDSHTNDKRRLTFSEIMAQSSNIGTIKIAQRLGAERLAGYLERFGYGRPSGLAFPGESAGLLALPDQWSATSLPTISIGQGVSATLLQVADVFATIARGGRRVAPSLVRGTVGDDGRLRAAAQPRQRRVVSPETAETIAGMLVGVVEDEQGTCELCAVPGYRVAGKTGTAQKPSTTRRGYEPGAYIASFVGFAPADDPALVVGVALDEPRPVYYGGLTAGPAFSSIMNFGLRHRRVPPSDPRAVRPTVTPGTPVAAPPGAATGFAGTTAAGSPGRPAPRARRAGGKGPRSAAGRLAGVPAPPQRPPRP